MLMANSFLATELNVGHSYMRTAVSGSAITAFATGALAFALGFKQKAGSWGA